MDPFNRLYDWLEARYSKRQLSKLASGAVLSLILLEGMIFGYAFSVSHVMMDMAHAKSDRAVVIDVEDLNEFEQHYRPDLEVGWCLYGYSNATHFVIQDVAQVADPMLQKPGKIAYGCLRETLGQMLHGQAWRLIGDVHSHPGRANSALSRGDTLSWGAVSPIIELKGVYSPGDGVEFFTTQSLSVPLSKQVVRE